MWETYFWSLKLSITFQKEILKTSYWGLKNCVKVWRHGSCNKLKRNRIIAWKKNVKNKPKSLSKL